MSEISVSRPLLFVKLGGSLITDKSRRETVRQEVLARLAGELGEGIRRRGGGVVIGHGSGSFGHVAASEHGFDRRASRSRPEAISAVQDAAARLHRTVVAALLEAGVCPYSIVPGSVFRLSGEGADPSAACSLVASALDNGTVPVLYGDLVLGRRGEAAIMSTEDLFVAVIEGLLSAGREVERILWLGETAGILGSGGAVVERIDTLETSAVEAMVGGSSGTDVTGGMKHRLETALRLARQGVASCVADGRVEGLLAEALAGGEVPGTEVGSDSTPA